MVLVLNHVVVSWESMVLQQIDLLVVFEPLLPYHHCRHSTQSWHLCQQFHPMINSQQIEHLDWLSLSLRRDHATCMLLCLWNSWQKYIFVPSCLASFLAHLEYEHMKHNKKLLNAKHYDSYLSMLLGESCSSHSLSDIDHNVYNSCDSCFNPIFISKMLGFYHAARHFHNGYVLYLWDTILLRCIPRTELQCSICQEWIMG